MVLNTTFATDCRFFARLDRKKGLPPPLLIRSVEQTKRRIKLIYHFYLHIQFDCGFSPPGFLPKKSVYLIMSSSAARSLTFPPHTSDSRLNRRNSFQARIPFPTSIPSRYHQNVHLAEVSGQRTSSRMKRENRKLFWKVSIVLIIALPLHFPHFLCRVSISGWQLCAKDERAWEAERAEETEAVKECQLPQRSRSPVPK